MLQVASCEQSVKSVSSPILELQALSEDFWQENQDLLPESVGLICLSGMGPEGQLANIDMQKNPYNEVFSAIFDARHEATGVFTWQLGWAYVGGARTVQQYSTANDGSVTATTAEFDVQGRFRHQSTHPASRTGYPVRRVLEAPEVQTKLVDLKVLRHKAMANIDNFNYNVAYKLSDYEAEKKRKELTDYLQHLVLSPLAPLNLNDNQPIANLQQTLDPKGVR